MKKDMINNPDHYTQHPSGVECIDITKHFDFCKGNAIKYIWRSGKKANEVEDLQKAIWYLEKAIEEADYKVIKEAAVENPCDFGASEPAYYTLYFHNIGVQTDAGILVFVNDPKDPLWIPTAVQIDADTSEQAKLLQDNGIRICSAFAEMNDLY